MTNDTISTTSNSPGAAMDRKVAPSAKRKLRKRLIRVAAGVAVLALAVLGWLLIPGANSLAVARDAIRTGAVARAPYRDYVPLRAEVTPLRTVYVSAVSGGQVDAVIAADGARVAAGQPLALLTNPGLEREVASRSADIAGALSGVSNQRLSVQRTRMDSEREIADAENELMKARHDLHVKQTLFDANIVNEAAVEPLRAEVAYQQERVAALRAARGGTMRTLAEQSARISETATQLQRSQSMLAASLDALTLRAPVAGRLTAFELQPGQTLAAGDRVGQVDSAGAWKLVADVDQYHLSRVRTGQHAEADIDGRRVTLEVIKVLPQVTDGRFRIELGFAGDPPAGLNRGQIVDVRLILGADRAAVVAPAGSWLDAGGTAAFVIDGNRAVRREIAVGRRNPEQVEILSGIAPGERIVTSSLETYQSYQTLLLR